MTPFLIGYAAIAVLFVVVSVLIDDPGELHPAPVHLWFGAMWPAMLALMVGAWLKDRRW